MSDLTRRHEHERGGALLYLMIPVVLVAGAAGLLFMFKDTETVKPLKETLRPYLAPLKLMSPPIPQEDTGLAAGDVVSATASQLLTVSELYGDPESPALRTLDQIRSSQSDLQARERQLADQRQRFAEEQRLLKDREKQLQEWIAQAEAQLQKQRESDQERQAYQSSERVKRIRDLSATVLKLSPKNAAGVFQSMWTGSDPEGKTIVIETLRSLGGSKMSKIVDAMAKANPQTASEIVIELINDKEHDPGSMTG